MSATTEFFKILSLISGWVYCGTFVGGYFCISFEIFRLKTSAGLSWNYLMLSFLGYLYYLLYFVYGSVYPQSGLLTSIHIEDYIFLGFAILWHFVCLKQLLIYPGSKKNKITCTYATLSF